jgi:hypothetical protein
MKRKNLTGGIPEVQKTVMQSNTSNSVSGPNKFKKTVSKVIDMQAGLKGFSYNPQEEPLYSGNVGPVAAAKAMLNATRSFPVNPIGQSTKVGSVVRQMVKGIEGNPGENAYALVAAGGLVTAQTGPADSYAQMASSVKTDAMPAITNPSYNAGTNRVYTEIEPLKRHPTDKLPTIPVNPYEIPDDGDYMSINTGKQPNSQHLYESLNNIQKPTTKKPPILALGSVNNTTRTITRQYTKNKLKQTLKQLRKNSLNLSNPNLELFRKIAINARIRNMPIDQKINLIRKLTGN